MSILGPSNPAAVTLSRVSRDGVVLVDAYTRQGAFVLRDPVDYGFGDGSFVRVPAGFAFDGASIPPSARSLVRSLTTAGNVLFGLHDCAYSVGSRRVLPTGAEVEISRAEADWMALSLCEWLGMSQWDCLKVYAALDAFGGFAFHKLPITRTIDQVGKGC